MPRAALPIGSWVRRRRVCSRRPSQIARCLPVWSAHGSTITKGEAIAIIVEQLQFVFNSDGSGSITFQRVTTQFQTGCAENFIASWPDGMWDFVNGNRLNWTGAGSSIDTNSCIPGHTTMTLGSSFFFKSVRLVQLGAAGWQYHTARQSCRAFIDRDR